MRTILKAAAAANPISVPITIEATAQPLHSHFFPNPQIARILFLGTKWTRIFFVADQWYEIHQFLGTNWPIIGMS